MASSNMFLFWGSGSVPCWKAMIALEEKGFSGYPNKMVSFSNKEHKSDEVLKLNPRGQMPTFKDGDIVVNESAAICEYLDRQYPDKGTKLIPNNTVEQANVLQRMHEIGNLNTAFINDLIKYVFGKSIDGEPKQEETKKRIDRARDELNIWEGYMKQNGSGAFIASKNFSMVDVFFFPYFAFAVRLGLNLDKFPALSEYYGRMKDRPSIKKSWPQHWHTEPSKASFLNAL